MSSELKELIRDAQKELRKASGLPLTSEELNEDLRKSAVAELDNFIPVESLGLLAGNPAAKNGSRLQLAINHPD